jgi:hypothetical protein
MGTDASFSPAGAAVACCVTVCTGQSELWRGSLSDRILIAVKPVRRFIRFTRGTDSLQRPVPVDPHSEPR